MNFADSKIDTLQLLVEQLGINNRFSELLGLIASRLDPTGEDEELKSAFEKLNKSNTTLANSLRSSIDKLKGEVKREPT